MSRAEWVEEVNRFWFEEIEPGQWFRPDPAMDAEIRRRFLELYQKLKQALPEEARTDARAALAAILLFDQFPRNMFRGRPEAFATDPLACALTRNAVDQELDNGLNTDERRFLYMPLMHSEVLADQEWGVSLFRSLDDPESLRYAIEHRDIIARFGRFPHRNNVLGRENTPEEEEFLRTAERYGQ